MAASVASVAGGEKDGVAVGYAGQTACVLSDSGTDQGLWIEAAAGAPRPQVRLLPVRLESPLTAVSGNPPVASRPPRGEER